MESTNVDEFIIDYIHENKCIYDKSDPNFKNINKKKEVWSKISENLENLCRIELSAEAIEKRWSSLRDMFGRENRKKRSAPPGSECEPTKEWELYRNMLFLLPHIAPRRRRRSSSVPVNQSVVSIKRSLLEMNNLAKHRKNKDDQINHDLAEANSVISTAVKTIATQISDQNKRKTDGYMLAIQEGLDYVPAKNKTQCLIEVLQVIQKYEERS